MRFVKCKYSNGKQSSHYCNNTSQPTVQQSPHELSSSELFDRNQASLAFGIRGWGVHLPKTVAIFPPTDMNIIPAYKIYCLVRKMFGYFHFVFFCTSYSIVWASWVCMLMRRCFFMFKKPTPLLLCLVSVYDSDGGGGGYTGIEWVRERTESFRTKRKDCTVNNLLISTFLNPRECLQECETVICLYIFSSLIYPWTNSTQWQPASFKTSLRIASSSWFNVHHT